MSFGKMNPIDEKNLAPCGRFPWTMYAPQSILLIILGTSGIYLWPFISELIKNASALI